LSRKIPHEPEGEAAPKGSACAKASNPDDPTILKQQPGMAAFFVLRPLPVGITHIDRTSSKSLEAKIVRMSFETQLLPPKKYKK
jgi:hypothetical protein